MTFASAEIAAMVRSSVCEALRIQLVAWFDFRCRVSGRISRSPTLQPLTACESVTVVWPARGSAATRVHVGVFGAPCIVTMPKPRRPVPYCSGSVVVLMGLLAMTICAVKPAPTGTAAVPISSAPVGMIIIVPTVSSVLRSVRNASRPFTARQGMAVVLERSYVTLVPQSTFTTSAAPGTRAGDQMAGLDHTPELTLLIVALAQKSGML